VRVLLASGLQDRVDTKYVLSLSRFAALAGPSLTSESRSQSRTDAIVRANPHIVYGESARRGYFLVDLTAERCVAALRVLDDVNRPDAAVSTAATFEIAAGRPGVATGL
jgi:phosphodiesterase/alkaline phosphatase D-like protein